VNVKELAMAVSAQGTARQIGQAFADVVHREPCSRRLWVAVQRDVVSLWLLTDSIDLEAERRLYPLLDAVTPIASGAFVRLYVLNPRHGDLENLGSILPAGASEVALAAAQT
jgi:hypothetical protein